MEKRYFDFNTYLRNTFGCRVQKITIDAGMSCPNRDGTLSKEGCIYCNTRGSGTGAYSRGISITQQLINGKKMYAKRYKAKQFIAYFQSFTNTYAPIETLKQMYDEALSVEGIIGLSVGTRPDCVSEPILNLLHGYTENHMIWIEYGLQSAHDTTLAYINRGHDFSCFKSAVESTKNRGIKICAHVILGLPREEKKHMIETAKILAVMGIDGVKLHLLYVVKGTQLEKLYRQGEYKCLKQKESVELVCDFLENIPKDMVIQRLTGDPHPDELVAPKWSLNKTQTLTLIKERLTQRNTWQGKRVDV